MKQLNKYYLLDRQVPIAPLITFRILFGGLMMVGALRFMWSGWIERLYVEPQLFFKFYGFEWVHPLGQTGMYVVYSLIAISAALVMLGWFYRLAIAMFFLSFTYTELIDVTNYLNHYYLVVLLAFLLLFLPANRRFSLDVRWRKVQRKDAVPVWTIHVLILQISIVYCLAGFAKLNADWLLRAMPLAVWLPTKADLPLIGSVFQLAWIPYVFSWFGAFYDLTIPFWLMNKRTRPLAYMAVVVFHVLTKVLFNIGLFPLIMVFSTLIFFPAAFHEKLLGYFGYEVDKPPFFHKNTETQNLNETSVRFSAFAFLWQKLLLSQKVNWLYPAFAFYFAIQIVMPFRYLLYPGNTCWTEEGYRFSWRVMLVEKSGQATFYVSDPETGRRGEVTNRTFLTSYQEKQMAIQPDLILQYAHYLEKIYQIEYNIKDPLITVDSYVALNGRASQRFIDPKVDLTEIQDGFKHKNWVLPFKE